MHSIEDLFKKAEALRGANLRARTVTSLEEQLGDFLSGYSVMGIPRDFEQTWYRARKCDNAKKYNNLKELIYPADGSTSFGRAQLPNSKVLYASWNLQTALEEARVCAGDFVQLISIRVRSPLEVICCIIGELQYFYGTGRTLLRAGPASQYITELQYRSDFINSVFIDSFIAEIFRKQIDTSDDYKLSAIFSEKLHRGQGGIIFPSIRSSGAMNIAVPADTFDRKFEVLETQLFKVTDYFGYGIYNVILKDYSSSFSASGDIRWASSVKLNSVRNAFGGEVFNPIHIGWRVK